MGFRLDLNHRTYMATTTLVRESALSSPSKSSHIPCLNAPHACICNSEAQLGGSGDLVSR